MDGNPIQTEFREFIGSGNWESREHIVFENSWMWGLFLLLSSVFFQADFIQIQIYIIDPSSEFSEQNNSVPAAAVEVSELSPISMS